MREVLFRGFTPVENGKSKVFVNGKWIEGQWVEGSYWKLNKTTYCFKEDYERNPDNTEHYIVFDQMTDWCLPNRHLQADVIPETVGQFTGLTDKNGQKIFEGDILQVITGNGWSCPKGTKVYYEVVFTEFNEECATWAEYIGYMAKRDEDDFSSIHYIVNSYGAKVIGNIHDNPELLKGGAE